MRGFGRGGAWAFRWDSWRSPYHPVSESEFGMKMTQKQLDAFGAQAGAYSIVTGREEIDGQLTFDKAEKAVLFSRKPKPKILRGKVQGREGEAALSVRLYKGSKKRGRKSVYVNYPKKRGNEIRLYFKEGVFSPRVHDVWFIILTGEGELGIGSCDPHGFLEATGALSTKGSKPGSAGGVKSALVPRTKREINARRGQPAFRRAMLQRFEVTCCVTGSKVADVLEAAHIATIPGGDDNRPENGLLLRSDVHTLHDLGLLAVNPEDLGIHVVSVLKRSEYKRYIGKHLRAPLETISQIDRDSLRTRWQFFLKVTALFTRT